MDRPRIHVDFNEMLDTNLVLLSKEDAQPDSSGAHVLLSEGMPVHVYMDDLDEAGAPDPLIADGVVERNVAGGWAGRARWCCRIGAAGIRHLSDLAKP